MVQDPSGDGLPPGLFVTRDRGRWSHPHPSPRSACGHGSRLTDRRQGGASASHVVRVERRALRLHELVEGMRLEDLMQSLVERVSAGPGQLIGGDPQTRRPCAVLATTHSHAGSVVRRIDRVDPPFHHGLLGSAERGAWSEATWLRHGRHPGCLGDLLAAAAGLQPGPRSLRTSATTLLEDRRQLPRQ